MILTFTVLKRIFKPVQPWICLSWCFTWKGTVKTSLSESTRDNVNLSKIKLRNVRGVVWISLAEFFCQHCHHWNESMRVWMAVKLGRLYVCGGRGVRCVLILWIEVEEIELSDCHQHLQATSTICLPAMSCLLYFQFSTQKYHRNIFTATESRTKEGLVGFLWLSGFPGRWDEESKSKQQLFPGRR